MKPKLSDLLRWSGRINRSTYVVWGFVLFALKFNLDRFVFRRAFDSEWELANYLQWNFPSPAILPTESSPIHGMVMLAAAMPFLFAGVGLTIQRLRAARLPLWLAVLFVVPVLKWFLFLTASLVPTRASEDAPTRLDKPQRSQLFRWLPHSRAGSALAAVALTSLLVVGAVLIGAQWLENYGWGLFVGVPFLAGFLAAVLHGCQTDRTAGECAGVACLAITFAGACILLMALEGVICLVMAAPLAYPLAALGALVGYAVQPGGGRTAGPHMYCTAILALVPMLGAEAINPAPPKLIEVRTAISVNAPPERVWRHVVSFSELAPPTEAILRLGIAYPIRAEIHGQGVGAVRHCVFSTGPFVEPIEVWDAPRLLRFSVTSNPAPMQEWTPYDEIHPPHLEGFLKSERGQFKLTQLPDGRTELEGTTWYRHGLWPARYWQFWSDYIIHTIHRRVLNHVKQLSEKDSR
jgi:uncharacterized membrane protein YhaH (DUF805 family)